MNQPIIFTNRDTLGDLLCIRCEFVERVDDLYVYQCYFYINNVYKTQFRISADCYSDLQNQCYDYMLNF